MMEGRIRDDERVRQQCWEGASAMLGRRVRGWKGASEGRVRGQVSQRMRRIRRECLMEVSESERHHKMGDVLDGDCWMVW